MRNVLAWDDPSLLGYDAGAALEGADLVVVLDSGVPWIEKLHAPGPEVRVAHLGPDPAFRRMPVRGYRADLSVTADPVAALAALEAALGPPDAAAEARAAGVAARAAARTARTPAQPEGAITVDWLSHCVSEVMDDRAMAVSELGIVAGAMRLQGQNRLFCNPHSGGLGWAMPTALGLQLADRDRLVIATMGDGSHIFANPVACHQIAEAMDLPILTVIRNNAMWNAVRRSVLVSYPDGAASRANRMPLTSLAPQPDFVQIAQANRVHVERVEDPAALRAALARAVEVIRTERRPALVDVVTAVSESH